MSDEDGTDNAIDLDIEELKEQLNLPDNTQLALIELGERFSAINGRFGELLVYMNLIDERVQALGGEPQITAVLHQHVGQDGTAGVHRMRPATPELDEIRNPTDLKHEGDKSAIAKMVVNQ